VTEERLNNLQAFITRIKQWCELFGFDELLDETIEAEVTLQTLRNELLDPNKTSFNFS